MEDYRTRVAALRAAERAANRARAVEIYGGVCVMCGATDGLEFDHPNGDGGEHREAERPTAMFRRIAASGVRLPDRELRLLCRSCHRGKGIRLGRAHVCDGGGNRCRTVRCPQWVPDPKHWRNRV